ncbi:class I SAM-dependent methyltransferase [Burkholderia multivorans]|uniref:class I SAM-dependent methyltransferase n=1 Tax=Burkholderia multivorans TaxID=87883 RepID=UPI001C23DE22|nr:class I SAM-dependent methyltransferase [Burkholderia multivorans]MBU9199849.1 class I SAM-dependent methyltransferase [Burkholderia multivorans]MDN8079032.1 class I SAM-dependent methyltransferase [Burkholderia multivorans]
MPDTTLTAGYDAANLEAMSFARAYQAAMQDLVIRKLGLCPGTRVLDFGAGRGDYALGIHRQCSANVLCLEPDVQLHSSYPASLPVIASLDAMDAGQYGPMDCAYSLNVLEHINDDAKALRQLADRCQPGARLFALVPANESLWTEMDDLVGHRRRYTPETLRATAESAGLFVEETGWFDRTGYFATRAYQFASRLGLLKATKAGKVSSMQIRVFDALFRCLEPVLTLSHASFGKNCWMLARRP